MDGKVGNMTLQLLRNKNRYFFRDESLSQRNIFGFIEKPRSYCILTRRRWRNIKFWWQINTKKIISSYNDTKKSLMYVILPSFWKLRRYHSNERKYEIREQHLLFYSQHIFVKDELNFPSPITQHFKNYHSHNDFK